MGQSLRLVSVIMMPISIRPPMGRSIANSQTAHHSPQRERRSIFNLAVNGLTLCKFEIRHIEMGFPFGCYFSLGHQWVDPLQICKGSTILHFHAFQPTFNFYPTFRLRRLFANLQRAKFFNVETTTHTIIVHSQLQ